jgi:hypothetical protein
MAACSSSGGHTCDGYILFYGVKSMSFTASTKHQTKLAGISHTAPFDFTFDDRVAALSRITLPLSLKVDHFSQRLDLLSREVGTILVEVEQRSREVNELLRIVDELQANGSQSANNKPLRLAS